MHQPPSSSQPPSPRPDSPFKSRSGLTRILRAMRYSADGLTAAIRHEAAFRQELAAGLPLCLLAFWIAPTRLLALLLCASIVLVWVVELLNSAVEALADTVTLDEHPMIKRTKDLGSAAVMMSIGLAVVTWAVVLWP